MSNVKGVAVKPSQSLNLGKIRFRTELVVLFKNSVHIFFFAFSLSFFSRTFSDVNQQKKFIKFYKSLGQVSICY